MHLGPPKKVPRYLTVNHFFTPYSHKFCDSCNRVRVTVEGKLCLGNEKSVDLRSLLRANPSKPEVVKGAVLNAL